MGQAVEILRQLLAAGDFDSDGDFCVYRSEQEVQSGAKPHAIQCAEAFLASVADDAETVDTAKAAAYRAYAHDVHHDEGICEIDDAAQVNISEDGGAYVQAWLWVDADDLPEGEGVQTSKFNIAVPHLETKTYTVEAENWREAVEKASDLADADGLQTSGGVGVYDENHHPVDTWGGFNK